MNLTNQHEPSLAIVVASCDKYSDMWEPLFGEFFKYWPDCPYPVYLIANNKKSDHPRVITLLAGDDLDWSSTIDRAISQLNHTHALFWMDDVFLNEPVSNTEINSYFDWAIKNQARVLKLRNIPKPSVWRPDGYGVLAKTATYRATLFASIWEIPLLAKILNPGESAWDFEMAGTIRSQAYEGFYCTKKEVFNFLHGVTGGMWILPVYSTLKKIGYSIDINRRHVMTTREYLYFKLLGLKSVVINILPESQRSRALLAANWFYRKAGIR